MLYNVATYIFSIKTNAREILCCIRTGRVSHSANLDGHTGIRPHFGNRTGNGSMFKQIIGQLEKGSLKSIETSKRKIRKTQRANRSVIKAGRGNIQQGRPESLPFRDRSFQKVFSLHTAETVSDYRTACKEVYRVLQIDGCFYMVLKPSRMSEKDVIEVLYDQHFRDISVVSRDSFHFITAIK